MVVIFNGQSCHFCCAALLVLCPLYIVISYVAINVEKLEKVATLAVNVRYSRKMI